MATPTPPERYPSIFIWIHWLTLLCLIGVYVFIQLHTTYPKGSAMRELMKQWHFTMGLTVFVLVIVRLALRPMFKAPPIVPLPPRWQQFLAKVLHLILYAFLVGMPLLGWTVLSLKGKVIPFYGIELPPLASANKPLGKSLENLHELIGTLGYYLIGLHAAAALMHHYIMHDNALRRMLPWKAKENANVAQ